MTSTIPVVNRNCGHHQWEHLLGTMYRCNIYLYPENEGGYSAIAAELPGACSQGENEAEALENITEAITGLIESYSASGLAIPWEAVPVDESSNPLRRVVIINA